MIFQQIISYITYIHWIPIDFPTDFIIFKSSSSILASPRRGRSDQLTGAGDYEQHLGDSQLENLSSSLEESWRAQIIQIESDWILMDFDGFWWNHCNFHCKVNKDMFGALNGHDPISNGFLKSCAWGILSSSNLLVGAVPVRWGKYLKMPGLKWSCNQTIWFCMCLKMENVSLNDGHKMIRENDD